MAVVINGSGTVTGISVGGLPDGVVDAGTLADDAVVEAKIGANAVVTAAINDDAVTNAKVAANAIAEAQLAANAVVTGKIEDGTIAAGDLASGVGGKVLQVVQTVFTGISSQTNVTTQTNDSGGYGSAGLNWTDLDTTITPSSASSKILVMINCQFSTPYAVYGVYRLQRGINGATPSLSSSSGWMPPTSGSGSHWLAGTMIGSTHPGTTSGWGLNGLPPYAWQYLDSPNTTNAVKYRVNTYIKSDISGSGLIWLNRSFYGNNDYGTGRGVSTVTLMEIAG